jgi:hypothetical protein
MPNETPDFKLTPEEEEQAILMWKDVGYHKWLAGREAAADSDDSDEKTERILDLANKYREEREAQQPEHIPYSPQIPPKAQAKLDAKAKARSDEYDRLESQGQLTGIQIDNKLNAQDLGTPTTIEEEGAEEIADISRRAHASAIHKPRSGRSTTLRRPSIRYVSPRDAGPPPAVAEEVRRDQGQTNY